MSRRCAAISRPLPAASGPACICSPTPRACRNICRRRWPRSCANIPISTSTSRSAKAPTSRTPIATGAADLGFAAEHALPDNIERFLFSEDRLVLVAPRRSDVRGPAADRFSGGGRPRFRRADQLDRAAAHIAGHAARLGMRLRFRARLRDFDAICQMVAAGVGIAVVPEAAARRCARSMPIDDRPDPRSLGQPQAGDLRPQLQGAAAAGEATGGASAQGGCALRVLSTATSSSAHVMRRP